MKDSHIDEKIENEGIRPIKSLKLIQGDKNHQSVDTNKKIINYQIIEYELQYISILLLIH